MPINEEERQLLIKTLQLTRDQYAPLPAYDQNDFGNKSCGTVACMAGLAYFNEIGEQWRKEIELYNVDFTRRLSLFPSKCIEAGCRLLGIEYDPITPQIFLSESEWPEDLQRLYDIDKVEAAIEALKRINDKGMIADENGSFEYYYGN